MLRTRLTYANVMSTLLVFAALGGTSYAVTTLDANSVRSKHIRNGQVKRADLARNSVDSSKVADGALVVQELAAGQLPSGPRGPQGERGLQGRQGEEGEQGERGPRGGISAVRTQFFQLPTDLADGASQTFFSSTCPAGERAIGGGVRGDSTESEETNIVASRPAIDPPRNLAAPTTGGTFKAWAATVQNRPGGVTTGIRPEVWVVCIED